MYDFLIVGAGFSGCVLAERLSGSGNKILLVDKRNHIAGNAYDYYNDHSILVHRYGPHIFHTNNKKVWEYLSGFTEWRLYQHRVKAFVDGMQVTFPVNLDTVNQLFGHNFSISDFITYITQEQQSSGVTDIKNAEDMAMSRVGENLYEKFFKNYTIKQWGVSPKELAAEITARIPIRYNRDSRYFSDCYQGLPKYGYTKMFEKILSDSKIHLLLQTDYKKIIDTIKFGKMIYTGPIDYYFDFKYGKLPYRSLEFEFETIDTEYFQSVGTVNYPNDYQFTRITEFKQLTGQKSEKTTIMREYSKSEGEPYYPILNTINNKLYQKYFDEAQECKDKFFIGRLAEYRYYNMDVVVEKALELFETFKN
jgi:UDP-galactopyranose mutase